MPAMFAALLIGQIESRRHLLIGLVAAALAILFALVLPGKRFVVAAAIAAATVGAAVYR
jgi:predicted branched-subunit amino acid permease